MSAKRRKRRATPRAKTAKRRGAGAARKKNARSLKRAPKRAASKRKRAPTKVKKKAAAARKTTRSAPSKAELRKTLRARRQQLSDDAQRRAADRAAANLATTRLFLASRRIACYLPTDGEIDPTQIIQRIWRMGKTAYLPVLSRLPHDRLWFAPATPGMELVPNRFGIPEPRVKASELLRAERLDLILLPAVAVDAKGNRLGRGAGFYDRSLAFLRRRRFLRKPHLVALVHDFQRVPALPADPWDIPLDGIVSDQAVRYINR